MSARRTTAILSLALLLLPLAALAQRGARPFRLPPPPRPPSIKGPYNAAARYKPLPRPRIANRPRVAPRTPRRTTGPRRNPGTRPLDTTGLRTGTVRLPGKTVVIPKLSAAQRTAALNRLSRARQRLKEQRLARQRLEQKRRQDEQKTGQIAGLTTLNARAIQNLSRAAQQIDPSDRGGQLTAAGRALQKHGGRPGSVFPNVKGNPTAINAQGQKIVHNILNNPRSKITQRTHPRYGQVTEIVEPNGRGLRYSADGKLIGFLEPPRK